MPNKKINELSTLTDVQVNDDTRLFAEGSASTGELFKITVLQAKTLFYPKIHKYTATGSEGSTLTIATIANKDILMIMREAGPIFEVASAPDSAEFTWNLTDIVLGTPVAGAGERFLILYTNG